MSDKYAALKRAAEKATWGDWTAYQPHKGARGHEVKVGIKAVAQHCLKNDAGYIALAGPKVVLELLAERDADKRRIEELTAERDALREGEMGDGKHSNTRAAADIYFQLVEECEIPAGGSLVEHIDDMRQRITELEAQEIKPAQGEVLVTVTGYTGCGKSAIAGEIEIAMKAIGVPVQWTNGDAEKRMTGADWLTAIEMYKPSVRIFEVNLPRAAGISLKIEGE